MLSDHVNRECPSQQQEGGDSNDAADHIKASESLPKEKSSRQRHY